MATEEEIALRTKKGNVRRAHRASATRLINQIDGAIVSADVRRLKQLKQSLTNKLTVLARLDDELIGLVEDDDLEAESRQMKLERRLTSPFSPLKMPSRTTKVVQLLEIEPTPAHQHQVGRMGHVTRHLPHQQPLMTTLFLHPLPQFQESQSLL